MNANEIDALEDSLGIVLPEAYVSMLRRLHKRPLRGILAELVCTDGQAVVSLNERVSHFDAVAGLPAWPDELFVIGEDGCGNYYAIRHEEEDSAVFFFNHERDEIQQCAKSLEDFCKRLRTLAPLDAKVVHRSRRRSRTLDQDGVIPDFKSQPEWATDWAAFVKVFAGIVGDKPSTPATVKKLNKTFGSRAVRWTGRLVSIEFGKEPAVEIKMPATAETRTERFRDLSDVYISLRSARSPGVSMSEAGTPQVVTTRDAWRDCRRGDQIQFLMMIAPGHEDSISCIDARIMSVQGCGGHLLKIRSRSQATARKSSRDSSRRST